VEGGGSLAGAIVSHDALDVDAEACIVGNGGLEEATSRRLRLSGLIWVKAMREASSTQTWTNSHPTPGCCFGRHGRW
jgi:hypothetical protein